MQNKLLGERRISLDPGDKGEIQQLQDSQLANSRDSWAAMAGQEGQGSANVSKKHDLQGNGGGGHAVSEPELFSGHRHLVAWRKGSISVDDRDHFHIEIKALRRHAKLRRGSSSRSFVAIALRTSQIHNDVLNVGSFGSPNSQSHVT